jgi:hypothetical protein
VDLDEAAERLYGVMPDRFVAERTALAAEARAAGDRASGEAIRRLGKPSQPAWQVNLLVRQRPAAIADLAKVALALRAAAEGGDPREVRRVNAERRAVVSRLADEAGRLAATAGRPPTATTRREVESTLHAALSSEEAAAQVASGRMVAAQFDTGLDALGLLTLMPAPSRSPASAPSRGVPRGAAGTPGSDLTTAARSTLDAASAALTAAEGDARAARALAEQGVSEVSLLEARLTAVRARAAAAEQEAVEAEMRAGLARAEQVRAAAALDALRGV